MIAPRHEHKIHIARGTENLTRTGQLCVNNSPNWTPQHEATCLASIDMPKTWYVFGRATNRSESFGIISGTLVARLILELARLNQSRLSQETYQADRVTHRSMEYFLKHLNTASAMRRKTG